jgi:hypothetical protein
MRSVKVVLPESMWALMPMLRTKLMGTAMLEKNRGRPNAGNGNQVAAMAAGERVAATAARMANADGRMAADAADDMSDGDDGTHDRLARLEAAVTVTGRNTAKAFAPPPHRTYVSDTTTAQFPQIMGKVYKHT